MPKAAWMGGITAFLLSSALLLLPGWFGIAAERDTQAQAAAQVPAAPVFAPAPKPVVAPPVAEVLQQGVLIVISKRSQKMFVFKDGELWAMTPVSTGRKGHGTPSGVFPILQKAAFHRSNIYSGAPMPHMQRLTWSGIAIHAGQLPGYPASHGCIRVPARFAKALFDLTRTGDTTVVVTGEAIRTDEYAVSLALNTPVPPLPGAAAQPAQPTLAAAPAPRIEALPVDTVPVASMPVQASGRGQTIQLAAAPSQAEAEAHWHRLVAAHPEFAGYSRSVIPAVVNSRQVYRLRMTAPGAHDACTALRRAGEDCFRVG